jgi:2-keto-3-deoxy-L-rhamnonate aldolase RhmA
MEFISITKDPKVASLFELSGIDTIMVDLEIIGKKERQKGLNTVISAHTMDDITNVKNALNKSKCLVRVNPIYEQSAKEINEAIERGADALMLPMFKTAEEVEDFVNTVGNRAEKYLLLENAPAMVRVDDILKIKGIDAIHIGLNDLSISMGIDFLYEPLIGGIVEYICGKIKNKGIRYGFGGVSRLERGKLILSEHYRLGSEMVILNRDFRYYKDSFEEIVEKVDIKKEVEQIRAYLSSLENEPISVLENNREMLVKEIEEQIVRLSH